MITPRWFLNKSLVAYLLLPVSIIYYFVSKLVYFYRLFYQKTSKRPVICIGNIFAGGVGKTPIVREIAGFLDAPVVMRGYKSGNDSIGDEAKMMQNAGIEVYVGDRKSNIAILNKKISNAPIIFDDGFQNPGIKKDISILVFDENLGIGNGFVLPAGPLRETLSGIKRADAIIIINSEKSVSKLEKIFHKYNKPIFYAKTKTINPTAGDYIAFAGIGYPKKFFDALKPKALKCVSFPDHYQYKKSDLDKLFNSAKNKNAELITTEKDWVRLPKYAQKNIKVAQLKMTIDNSFFNWLKEKLSDNI